MVLIRSKIRYKGITQCVNTSTATVDINAHRRISAADSLSEYLLKLIWVPANKTVSQTFVQKVPSRVGVCWARDAGCRDRWEEEAQQASHGRLELQVSKLESSRQNSSDNSKCLMHDMLSSEEGERTLLLTQY